MNIDLFLYVSRVLIAVVAPWLASVLLLGTTLIAITYSPRLYRGFLSLHRWVRILLILTIVLATYIRFAWVPTGHRIFFDEERYLSYAVNFARHNEAVSILLATKDEVILGDPDPAARITVPVLHAWTLRFFGYSEDHLFTLARIWSVAQILILFLTVKVLFDDEVAALISAVFLAFVPISVYWSVSTNIDLYFVTFALLSLLAATLYARETSLRTLLLFCSLTTLFLMVRFESFLFLPSLVLCVWSVRKHAKQQVFSSKDFLSICILVPIILVRAAISLPVFSNIWCCAEATPLEIFSPTYVFRNTIPNAFTFVNRLEFPFILTVCAAIYVIVFQRKKIRKDPRLTIFFAWIFFFFWIYSFYYAGQFYSYTFSGSYGRFFLMEVPPILILASLGIHSMYRHFIRSSFTIRNWYLVGAFCCLLTLVPTISSYRRLIRISPWDTLVEVGPRTLHQYMDEVMIPNTPPDSAIIFGILAPVHLVGKTAVYTDNFMNDEAVQDFVAKTIQSGTPVFYFETHTCELYPEKCTQILKRFTFTSYPPTSVPSYPGLEMKKVELREP